MTRKARSSVVEDDDGRMDSQQPRGDGPRRRRAFSASEKLAHLGAYEQACEDGDGGGYLRREGLYSSLISEWRKQRDAGVLAGKAPGGKVGRLSAEQAEIARLTRENCQAPGLMEGVITRSVSRRVRLCGDGWSRVPRAGSGRVRRAGAGGCTSRCTRRRRSRGRRCPARVPCCGSVRP